MIQNNLEHLHRDIETIAKSSRRHPEDIRVVLITKNVSEERIREAYQWGARDLGENRVQELAAKKPRLPADIRWHFVGHLQTNKVKDVANQVVLIHSLDSVHLAKELEKAAGKLNMITEVLLEVNTSGEQTKFGFDPEQLEDRVGEMTRFAHLKIRGLMTIGPLTRDAEKIRASFRLLRELQKKMKFRYPDIDWRELSMGMSDDYRIAIEEGATILRIGRAVFGERKQVML